MECLNCINTTLSDINCPFCSKSFCSFSCLETHMICYHQSTHNLKNNIYEKPKISRIHNNKLPKASSISSPYITYGFIARNLIYEKKYDLDNFIPELEYKEPIIIGSGSYGKVYLYRNIIDNKLYAIKHMKKMRLLRSLKTLSGIYEEIYIQSRIFHKNIVRLLYVKENCDSFDLVMEFSNKGSLFFYIRERNYLTEKESFNFFSQIANAVYFLHKNDLIHRDIKPENILLFDNNICKLCDFGWCVKLDGKQRSTFCGTAEYMSPEIVNKLDYSKEIDVWSLGILLYEMVHGYSPFRPKKENFNAKEVIDNIKIHDLKFSIFISEECKELICHLLDENKKKRYKIEDIFNSRFFKKYEEKKLFFPEEEKKMNSEIKPLKLNNNNKKNNINNNNYSLYLYFSPTKKLKKERMLPAFLKKASLINKGSDNNNKNNNINLNKNDYKINNQDNNKNNKNNNINEDKNPLNLSFENKKSKYNEIISDLNNNQQFYTSNTNKFLNNNSKGKLNLSEPKHRIIFNNIKTTKELNLDFSNLKKNVKNSNTKNIINKKLINEVSSINNSSYNERSDINKEEKNKENNINLTNENIIYNSYKNNNKNNNNSHTSKKTQNSKDKKINNSENDIKKPFATVKKLSNENNSANKDIINYNNYIITFRKKNQDNKQYEMITIYDNSKKNSLSERGANSPKNNIKNNKQLSNNIIPNNNNYSKEENNKRKIANSLKLDKINDMMNNMDILHNFNISSIENNNDLNAEFFNSAKIINTHDNKINYYINTPIYEETQYDNRFNNTYRAQSNRLFNRNYINNFSSLNNNFDNTQINTNYIFNPKISITLPSNNNSSMPKSKIINNIPNDYKIIRLGSGVDNNNYKKLSKSKSFLKTNFVDTNNKKNDNKLKILKNKELNGGTNKKKVNKKLNFDTPKFFTERDKGKKCKNNTLYKGNESIKMNQFSQYNNMNEKNNKKKIKSKNNDEDNINIFNLTEEDSQNNKLNNYKIIQRPFINSERNNLLSLRKVNHKIKLNNNSDNDKNINNKSRKNNFANSFSERILNVNKLKEKNSNMKLFTSRAYKKSKSKKNDDSQKTPRKNEDRIRIIPSKLLNNFSLEFNQFKNKGKK